MLTIKGGFSGSDRLFGLFLLFRASGGVHTLQLITHGSLGAEGTLDPSVAKLKHANQLGYKTRYTCCCCSKNLDEKHHVVTAWRGGGSRTKEAFQDLHRRRLNVGRMGAWAHASWWLRSNSQIVKWRQRLLILPDLRRQVLTRKRYRRGEPSHSRLKSIPRYFVLYLESQNSGRLSAPRYLT